MQNDGVHSRHSRGYSRRLGCRQCSYQNTFGRPWAPGPLPWFEITVDTGWGVRLADRRQAGYLIEVVPEASQLRTSIPDVADSLRC